MKALKEHEARMIRGGAPLPGKWVAIALLLGCPALGVFHLGVLEGYREEAES